ncbi:MAG: FecR domain-containing protein [Polyangia bacterium]
MTQRHWPEGSDRVSTELRRALDQAALRGPDDMTLRRGWAAVANPPEPESTRRSFWFAGGVASTAVLGVVAAVWLWPRAPERAPAARPHVVAHAETVAGPGARHLTLEGGVETIIGRSGVMRIDDGAPRVEAGEVRFSVPHRQPGHPFVVRAEGYRVVVVGTRFGISVQDTGVLVDVEEGIVEVWESATHRPLARLTPGESWQSPPREASNDTSAATPPAAAGAASAPVAAVPVAPAPAAAAPSFVVPSFIAHARHNHHRSVALSSPTGAADSGAPSAADARDPAIAARSAVAAGDAPRALQLYRSLAAQGNGPGAENAAYEIGKVLNEKMGQPAAAVSAWRQYRSTYPDGILRAEADVSIIETLARSGDADGALIEANEFLRRRPDSERRAEIARLAGDLYRSRGDCRHAVGMYQLASGASRPRDAVEAAAFHRAECLSTLGDSAAANAARGYLRAYPGGRFRSEAEALAGGASRP